MAPRKSKKAKNSQSGTATTTTAPVEDPRKDPGEVLAGQPAVGSPLEEQSTTEALSGDQNPAEDLAVITPAGEVPIKLRLQGSP